MPKKNLVLAGFMGTGKSTIGELVAHKSGSAFFDTDAEVVAQAGKTIAHIFAQNGEAHFRTLEAQVCLKAAQLEGAVVATGGGALVNPLSKARLEESGVLVNLKADFEQVEARLGADARRPLLKDKKEVRALFASRAALYNSLPHQVEVSGRAPFAIAEELIALWQQVG